MAITVSFTDTSTPGSSGPITAWAWTFGDGGTSTSQNPTHDYASVGDYAVQLVITGTSPDGKSAKTKVIRVA
jgi:PKD repeat protein